MDAKPKPKFKIGNEVKVKNGYGFWIRGVKTITGMQWDEDFRRWRYYIEPTDTPWFSHKEEDIFPA